MLALKRLPPDDRAEILAWRSDPALTTAAARQRLAERFAIQLHRDRQLSSFWKWQLGQAAVDTIKDIMEWDEDELQRRFPNITRDRIRDIVIKRGYAIAEMKEDLPLSLRVAAEDRRDRYLSLTIERWQLDVAAAAMAVLPQLREIVESDGLSEDEKLDQMRRRMFGVLPEDRMKIHPLTTSDLSPAPPAA